MATDCKHTHVFVAQHGEPMRCAECRKVLAKLGDAVDLHGGLVWIEPGDSPGTSVLKRFRTTS